MTQTRRRPNCKRRSNRRRSYRRGGAMVPLSPAPLTWSDVRMNAQPSQGVMRWATTAGAPMPSAAEMRNVAHGGKRSKRRTRGRKHRGRKHSRKQKHSRSRKH